MKSLEIRDHELLITQGGLEKVITQVRKPEKSITS